MDHGLPLFLSGAPVEAPSSRPGWTARDPGPRGRLAERRPGRVDDANYVTSEGRAAYVDLLPLDSTSRVLEVGCSLGRGRRRSARRAGSSTPSRSSRAAAFAAERLRQDGLDNVEACSGRRRLPPALGRGRFDVGVLNLGHGVMQAQARRVSALESQRRLLAEVARAAARRPLRGHGEPLRPAILGRRPRRALSNLRFASYLPRPALLPAALRLAGKPPASGNTHSSPPSRGSCAQQAPDLHRVLGRARRALPGPLRPGRPGLDDRGEARARAREVGPRAPRALLAAASSCPPGSCATSRRGLVFTAVKA